MAGEFGISMLTDRLMPQTSAVRAPKAESASLDPSAPGASTGMSFQDTLKDALGNVNEAMTHADDAARKFASGQSTNLHDVMIAMEKADISLRTLTAVRSKVVDAYQEIMRMQV